MWRKSDDISHNGIVYLELPNIVALAANQPIRNLFALNDSSASSGGSIEDGVEPLNAHFGISIDDSIEGIKGMNYDGRVTKDVVVGPSSLNNIWQIWIL